VREIKNTLITSEAVAASVLANIAAKSVGKYKYIASVYNSENTDEFLKTAEVDGDEIIVTKITRTIEAETASETLEGLD
jgi:hypothetical protein